MSGPIFVVGAGSGIGASVARRFAREGHPVGLVARSRTRIDAIVGDLRAAGHQAAAATGDITDPGDVERALGDLTSALGAPEVVCVSPLPDIRLIRPVLDTTAGDVRDALALTVVGASAVVQAVLPDMLDRGTGTLLFTTGGAAVRPSPERAVSAVAYAGLVSYLDLLAQTLPQRGIHVGRVTIVGAVGPGLTHEPDDIAEHLWHQHAARREPVTVVT
ncbi:SDR family NAD(P)-dependent oxidoreductase [Actinoallomurus rhizosphaericola]|uniref:SDR family NAD(P)-dependent oxidoreductase n=1 Tax=Actinoallomurus rhizosphaericola TaxID=2952536 RepID=UPI002091C134|nr:SDR family NAD(P)-dependent oxidoreductase [Actinoallomurus rhizosphaericola]MCO5994735.1 SDR family NAD(P)-dependent oxidoreductase [Actinoallomurus rhizosphaericola]